MSIPHMILGALFETPDHGYNLKNRFFSKLTTDFGINDGQLYPALKKLEDQGLISKEVQIQEGSPNRHLYRITGPGKDEFMKWLDSTEGEDRSFRYELLRKDVFLNKCMYLQFLPAEKALEKITAQIEVTEKQVSDFRAAVRNMREKGINPIKVKIAEYALSNQTARLKWLNEFHKTIKEMPEE